MNFHLQNVLFGVSSSEEKNDEERNKEYLNIFLMTVFMSLHIIFQLILLNLPVLGFGTFLNGHEIEDPSSAIKICCLTMMNVNFTL